MGFQRLTQEVGTSNMFPILPKMSIHWVWPNLIPIESLCSPRIFKLQTRIIFPTFSTHQCYIPFTVTWNISTTRVKVTIPGFHSIPIPCNHPMLQAAKRWWAPAAKHIGRGSEPPPPLPVATEPFLALCVVCGTTLKACWRNYVFDELGRKPYLISYSRQCMQ